jgi:hypothetical protein
VATFLTKVGDLTNSFILSAYRLPPPTAEVPPEASFSIFRMRDSDLPSRAAVAHKETEAIAKLKRKIFIYSVVEVIIVLVLIAFGTFLFSITLS